MLNLLRSIFGPPGTDADRPIPSILAGRYPDDADAPLPFVVRAKTDKHVVILPSERLVVTEDQFPLPWVAVAGAEAAIPLPFGFRVEDVGPNAIGGTLRPKCPDCGMPAGMKCPRPLHRPCPRGR